MASQIEQLRASFEKMNTTQKKAFIDNLKQKLQGNTNSEYTRFLNECVQKYNTAVHVGSPSSSRNVLDDLLDDLPTSGLSVAEPSERLIAYLIDFLFALPGYILIGIELHFAEIASNLASAKGGWYYRGVWIENSLELTQSIANNTRLYSILTILFGILGIGYLIFVLVKQIKYWKKGTSFGKNKKHLYVVHKDTGKTITTSNMFLREVFGKIISGMVFSLGFIWILLDKEKQAWHDKLVSSVVVKK